MDLSPKIPVFFQCPMDLPSGRWWSGAFDLLQQMRQKALRRDIRGVGDDPAVNVDIRAKYPAVNQHRFMVENHLGKL